MPPSLAESRIALKLRKLRSRFGIAAPQVSIRTHVPGYVRALGILTIVGASFALAGWAYQFGGSMAGFHQSESGQIVGKLQESNAALEEEVVRLRSMLATAQSSLQIELATQKQLAEKNKALVEENARLKEDVAVFERFSKLEGKDGSDISLDRLSVKAEAPGRYRYSFLLAVQNAKRGKESKLSLQIVVSPRAGSSGDKITFPRINDPDVQQYEIAVRNFRRVDGKFVLPREFAAEDIEFRILDAGNLRASKSISL
jgi:hypothetical protein